MIPEPPRVTTNGEYQTGKVGSDTKDR